MNKKENIVEATRDRHKTLDDLHELLDMGELYFSKASQKLMTAYVKSFVECKPLDTENDKDYIVMYYEENELLITLRDGLKKSALIDLEIKNNNSA